MRRVRSQAIPDDELFHSRSSTDRDEAFSHGFGPPVLEFCYGTPQTWRNLEGSKRILPWKNKEQGTGELTAACRKPGLRAQQHRGEVGKDRPKESHAQRTGERTGELKAACPGLSTCDGFLHAVVSSLSQPGAARCETFCTFLLKKM